MSKLPDGVREQHEFEGDEALEIVNRHVLNLDPPDRTRLCRLVSQAFRSKRIQDLESRIQALTTSLLDDLIDGDDLIAKVALPVPVTAIAELLGVPIDDQSHIRGLVNCLGAPLARLEATIVFDALLDRFPDIDFAIDAADLQWTEGFVLRGVKRLPVAV